MAVVLLLLGIFSAGLAGPARGASERSAHAGTLAPAVAHQLRPDATDAAKHAIVHLSGPSQINAAQHVDFRVTGNTGRRNAVVATSFTESAPCSSRPPSPTVTAGGGGAPYRYGKFSYKTAVTVTGLFPASGLLCAYVYGYPSHGDIPIVFARAQLQLAVAGVADAPTMAEAQSIAQQDFAAGNYPCTSLGGCSIVNFGPCIIDEIYAEPGGGQPGLQPSGYWAQPQLSCLLVTNEPEAPPPGSSQPGGELYADAIVIGRQSAGTAVTEITESYAADLAGLPAANSFPSGVGWGSFNPNAPSEAAASSVMAANEASYEKLVTQDLATLSRPDVYSAWQS